MVQDEPYLTFAEVMKRTGIKRGTLYNYCHRLGITIHRFWPDRRAYITTDDCERLKILNTKPWLIGEQVNNGEKAN